MRKLFWKIGSIGVAFLRSCPRIATQPSVYPERKRKSFLRRYLDLLYLRFRDGAICHAYNGLGLDIIGRSIKSPICEGARERMMTRYACLSKVDYTVLLGEKYLFFLFMQKHNLPVVPVEAYICNGIVWKDNRTIDLVDFLESLKKENDAFFIKEVAGLCGKGCIKIQAKDGEWLNGKNTFELASIFKTQHWVVQKAITNHATIRALNPDTLNTMRIATCWINNKVELWDSGMLRIGRAGGEVDNFFQGGIGIGITESGTLRSDGYTHTKEFVYSRLKKHPDSQISFAGIKLPYYEDTVELVKNAHAFLPDIPSIGWDVAITENGPLLLEGNHDWDVEMLQIVHNYSAKERYDLVYKHLI